MDNDRYKEYDQVVYTVMMNVLVEHERCKKFIVYDFDLDSEADVLYFNVTLVAADLMKEKVYLKMSFINYLKLRKKFGLKRANIRWMNPISENKIDNNLKTKVGVLMNYVKDQLELDEEIFGEINRTYYGC